MVTAGSILISGIVDGEDGYNTAVVQLFRRYTPTQAAPTPALPNGALTYTFSTGKLAGSYFNGWSQNIPSAASGGKLFVTMATARSQGATDSIAQNEWATPVEYVTDGTHGEPGISQAPVIIYKRYATQPTDKPADGAKYYFKTVGSTKAGSLVGTLNGWSTVIPANTNGLPCWARQATAVAPATADYDEIAASEWSDPATKLVEDGTSPYFADIDNEMDSVALDVSGNTTAAYSKTIGVMLWHGSEEMTLTDIVISGTTAAVTATKNVANKTITVSVAAGTSIPLTTELTITPQATGAPNDQSVHFVLNGVKPGANGQHATLYSLIPDADVITKEADGTPTFDILNFTIIKRVGTAETVITSISSFSNEGLKLYYKVGSGSEVEVTTSYMSGGYTNVNYHDIEQLYGATDEKIEWILRKASNNQLLDKEGIGSVKDGADSTVPGPAAVMYSISLAGSVLANDPNTGKLIVSIVGRVYKTEGDTTTPYTALTKSNLYLYFEKADGSVSQVPAGDISVSDNQFTTTCQNGANYSNEVLLGVRFNIDNVIKARGSIQVVKYGTNGQSITGHTGRFFYYAGDYSGVPGNYAMQETQGPYVKVTNGANLEFWMLDFKGVEPASFPARATEAPSDQSTQWTKMSSEQQYYIARAFFGPYAHLGSFIINGDWMISQYGVLVNSSAENVTVNSDNVNTLYDGKVPYAWFDPFFINGAELCRDVDVTVSYILAGSASFKGNKTYKIKITATNLDKGGSAEAVMKCRMYNGSNVGDTIQLTPSEPTAILEFTPTATGQYSLRCDMSTNGASGQVTAVVTNQFIPIFAVDGLTGETYQDNAHVRGRIVATSGEFTGKVTAESGDIAGPLDVTGGLNVKDSSNVIKVKINGGNVSTESSPGEITIVDAEGFYVKRGNEGFRLTTQGFQRWNSGINQWVNFYGGRYVRTIRLTSTSATAYNVSVNDDFIIANPSVDDTVLNLPSSNIPDGKILAVVNTGPGIHIRAGSLKIQGAREYDQVTLNINDRMEFIYSSSSNKWYVNFMSKVDNG